MQMAYSRGLHRVLCSRDRRPELLHLRRQLPNPIGVLLSATAAARNKLADNLGSRKVHSERHPVSVPELLDS